MGKHGIDGIYKNNAGEYVIVEVKSGTTDNKGTLGQTNNGQQMSEQWITNHINIDPNLSRQERRDILQALGRGDVKLLKAEVTQVKPIDSGGLSGNIEHRELRFVGPEHVEVL